MRGPLSRQISAIDVTCDRALDAGVVVDSVRYHSDSTFLLELLAMIMGYQVGVLTGTQTIRTLSNENLQMDQSQIVELAAAVGDYRKSVYATCWAEKDALQ